VGTDNKHIAPPSIQPASNIGITSLNVGILSWCENDLSPSFTPFQCSKC